MAYALELVESNPLDDYPHPAVLLGKNEIPLGDWICTLTKMGSVSPFPPNMTYPIEFAEFVCVGVAYVNTMADAHLLARLINERGDS